MASAERKARRSVLAVRPVREIGPYHPIPLAICPESVWWSLDEDPTVDYFSITNGPREIFEFEGGEDAF
jgi:hypothetical protein